MKYIMETYLWSKTLAHRGMRECSERFEGAAGGGNFILLLPVVLQTSHYVQKIFVLCCALCSADVAQLVCVEGTNALQSTQVAPQKLKSV